MKMDRKKLSAWVMGVMLAVCNAEAGGTEIFIAPGECRHDAQEHVLYYMPAAGDDLARAEVVACGLKELMIFQGTAEQPAKHVHLRGLSFQHTSRTLMEPYETRLRGDWAIARRAAVRFDGVSGRPCMSQYLHDYG